VRRARRRALGRRTLPDGLVKLPTLVCCEPNAAPEVLEDVTALA
jgi:hypothetical protein